MVAVFPLPETLSPPHPFCNTTNNNNTSSYIWVYCCHQQNRLILVVKCYQNMLSLISTTVLPTVDTFSVHYRHIVTITSKSFTAASVLLKVKVTCIYRCSVTHPLVFYRVCDAKPQAKCAIIFVVAMLPLSFHMSTKLLYTTFFLRPKCYEHILPATQGLKNTPTFFPLLCRFPNKNILCLPARYYGQFKYSVPTV